MAKPRKKQKKPYDGLSPVQLEEQARAHLDAGKFRKSRDAAKILFKQDPDKGRPLLIEANKRLAEKMMSDGKMQEAEQVISYLGTIASPEDLKSLTARSARQGDDWETVARIGCERLCDDAAVGETERIELADQIIVSFAAITEERCRGDVEAVRDALQATCESRWAESGELLRTVGRKSPFAHWAFFIKGLNAFYRNDLDRAAASFDRIPKASSLSAAAQTWSILSRPATPLQDQTPDPGVLGLMCKMAGHPEFSEVLPKAESFWSRNLHVRAYESVVKNVPNFPNPSVGFSGLLSELFMNVGFNLSPPQLDSWLDAMDMRFGSGKKQLLFEKEELLRMFLNVDANHVSDDGIVSSVRLYLDTRRRRAGKDPAFESVVHEWLGTHMCVMEAAPGAFMGYLGSREQQMRNSGEAVRSFERSIELDPSRVEPCLKLCALYENLKMKRERNRFLDQLSARFPENKQVLLLAGERGVDRRAFEKGVAFLERARAIDPLDSSIATRIQEARISQFQEARAKDRPERAQKIWDDHIWPAATDARLDFNRSRWALLVRSATLETIYGSPEQGLKIYKEALAAAPSVAICSFFRLVSYHVFKKRRGTSVLSKKELRPGVGEDPNLRDALALKQILSYWENSETYVIHPDYRQFINKYVMSALKRPYTRQEARSLVDALRGHFGSGLSWKRVVDHVLKCDPKDPYFRLHKNALRTTGVGFRLPAAKPGLLEDICAEAERRHDREALEWARRELRRAEKNQFPPVPPPLEMDDETVPDEVDVLNEVIARLVGLSEGEIDEPAANRGNSGGNPNRPTKAVPVEDPNQLDLF